MRIKLIKIFALFLTILFTLLITPKKENSLKNFILKKKSISENYLNSKKSILWRSKKPFYFYFDNVSLTAKILTKIGYKISPERLVLLVRLLYFEGAFDKKAKTKQDLKRGMIAISHVIKERLEYDKRRVSNNLKPLFSKSNPSLYNVGFKKSKNRFNSVTYQFSCIKKEKKYFKLNTDKKRWRIPMKNSLKWGIYGEDHLNICIGLMNYEKSLLAYDALVGTLLGKYENPAKNALYYQNKEKSDKYNQNWAKHLKFITKINTHDYYTLR